MKPLYVSLKPFLDHHVLIRPVDWPSMFGNDHPVEVEIGFGNGEFLARYCVEKPGVNLVGFEEYCERISRTLRKLSRVHNENVRVFRLDVRPAFKFLFKPKSISMVHCLFPPPWPKKGDIKHRLFAPAFLNLTNNRLKDGGILKIVTDFEPYAQWIQEQLPGCGFSLDYKVIPASYNTKFETKWVNEGKRDFYELILTKNRHIVVEDTKEQDVQHYTIDHFDPDHFQMADYSDGNIAVAFKDILYDPKRQTALIYVLVHDEHLLQNVRIVISKQSQGWRVNLAQGSLQMPTAGIAKAIELVRDAADLKRSS